MDPVRRLVILRLRGGRSLTAYVGDWLVTNEADADISVCPKHVFEKMYTPAEDDDAAAMQEREGQCE